MFHNAQNLTVKPSTGDPGESGERRRRLDDQHGAERDGRSLGGLADLCGEGGQEGLDGLLDGGPLSLARRIVLQRCIRDAGVLLRPRHPDARGANLAH